MKESPRWRGLVFIILAALLVSGLLYLNRIVTADAFSKEEAQHALYGYWLYHDLKIGDLNAFFYDTQRQMVWPFLHSWWLALVFLILGPSALAARSFSLVVFLLSLWLIYRLSKQLSEDKGAAIGGLAILLALTSPLMLRSAVENVLEGLGACLFLAVAYTYTVSEERKVSLEYFLLAILLALSIYTNYLYAYLLIPAYLLVTVSKLGPSLLEVLKLSRKGEKAAAAFVWWGYRKLILFTTLLVFAGIWFSYATPRKIMLMLDSIFHFSGGEVPINIWQALSYYPQVIIGQSTFSPVLGWLVLLALLVPMAASKFKGLNRLFIYVWTGIVLLTLTIPTKAPQLLAVLVPFCFIISAAVFFWALDKLQLLKSWLAGTLITIVCISGLIYLPNLLPLYAPPKAQQNMTQVLEFFKTNVPPKASIAASFNLKHLNPENLQLAFAGWEAPVLAENIPSESTIFEQAQYLLTIDLAEGSPYRAEVLDDSLYRWNRLLQEKEMTQAVRLVAYRRYESIGVTARIFKKGS